MTTPPPIRVVIPEQADRTRLDRALTDLVEGRSRAQIKRDLDAGAITLNGSAPAKGAQTTVRSGDTIVYTPVPPPVVELVAEDLPLDIIFEDEHLLVVNKAAGMVVHPALGHPRGTLVNAVLHRLRVPTGAEGDLRPGIVHRLDRDTTGLIVVAKHPECLDKMSALFKERQVHKVYLAITRGVPTPLQGSIDTFFGRHPTERKRFSSKVKSGKRALTHYAVQEDFRCAAKVQVRLETGRTHQIRVHLADKGHPLVGDETYGRNRPLYHPDTSKELVRFERPALHARRLGFVHPYTQAPVEFEAPIPDDLELLLDLLRSLPRKA